MDREVVVEGGGGEGGVREGREGRALRSSVSRREKKSNVSDFLFTNLRPKRRLNC